MIDPHDRNIAQRSATDAGEALKAIGGCASTMVAGLNVTDAQRAHLDGAFQRLLSDLRRAECMLEELTISFGVQLYRTYKQPDGVTRLDAPGGLGTRWEASQLHSQAETYFARTGAARASLLASLSLLAGDSGRKLSNGAPQ